jgi:hypothetical protein
MLQIVRSLNSLISRIRTGRRQQPKQAQNRLGERPSREDVVNGFRLILGRDIDDEGVIDAHMRISSVAELRRLLLKSVEFREKYKLMHPDACEHPSLTMGRDTLVFIHLRKTGGISLRNVLEAQFPEDRRCPVREDQLHILSAAELGHYDFFSGHFDQTSLRMIPRNEIKTVTLFREPRARLVSLYRFLRSHPIRDEFADDLLIRLANELSAEEFFERTEVRSSSAVFNNYVIALGGSYSSFIRDRPLLSEGDYLRLLEGAKRQVGELTALGITERFSQSVHTVFKSLELRMPRSIEELNVSDNLSEDDSRLRRVDPVTVTPRLTAALEDLIVFDTELYRFAVDEFERRITVANAASIAGS